MVSCYHDDHNCKSDLVWDEDGWIVQIICAGCNSVIGFMHPQAALDIGGADSQIGMKILAVFPDWKVTPPAEDVLKNAPARAGAIEAEAHLFEFNNGDDSNMTHGSLFAGIGGIDLGFDMAGIKTLWQVENNPACIARLQKRFPSIERFQDVKTCGSNNLRAVDVISGGFPCQDISNAGKRKGILAGERSGLWCEYSRIIGELRPRFVFIENSAALRNRGNGLGIILRDLAAHGYDAEWETLPASSFGAPHPRERLWIIAYSNDDGPHSKKEHETEQSGNQPQEWIPVRSNQWAVEPGMGRVVHGVPDRVDRIKLLGNAVIPIMAQWFAEKIKTYYGAV